MAKTIGLSKKRPVNEAIPLGTKREKKPKSLPKPAPKTAARPVPKATPKAAAKPTPKATPKATPKGLHQGRPVAAPSPKVQAQARAQAQAAQTAAGTGSGSFAEYPLLADLPALIEQQRELFVQIHAVDPLVSQEKALREEIEALMVASGLPEGDESVTCGDYVVRRIEQPGRATIDRDLLVTALVDQGLLDADEAQALADACTKTGDPFSYVTVGPTPEARKALKRGRGRGAEASGDADAADEVAGVA